MSKVHWAKAFLKQDILAISPLGEGRLHHLDLIELKDGSKWVCKKFSPQTWLGKVEEANLELTEVLAARVAKDLGGTFAAYRENSKAVFTLDNAMAIIIPYCEGQILPHPTEEQAFILGRVLAQLHALKLPAKGARPFPPIILENCSIASQQINIEKEPHKSTPSSALHAPAPCFGVEGKKKRSSMGGWLQELVNRCNTHSRYQADQWVVSHRDLHATNIIWRDKQTPHLLDWESAGFIHPAIELIGLATNCAGLAYGDYQPRCFRATLRGYGQTARRVPKLDSKLWLLSFYTWLLWYSYCLQQNWLEEAKRTIEIIELINEKAIEMQAIYADCYSFFAT